MRIKIAFVSGLGLGFIAGTRAGRGVYDRLVSAIKTVSEQPAVRQGAASVQAHASSSAKSAVHTVADTTRDAGASATHRVHEAWAQAQANRGHGDDDAGGRDDSRPEASRAASRNGTAAASGPSSPGPDPTAPGAGGYTGA
jgi:hypothetical protein